MPARNLREGYGPCWAPGPARGGRRPRSNETVRYTPESTGRIAGPEAKEGEWWRTDAFLDEIPAAYKPVEQVMADAAELVEVRHTLRQIVNVKGE